VMITAKRVVFPEPGVVRLDDFTFDPTPGDDEVVIRTSASIVSAGTELACLTGTEEWAKLPFHPGYGAVGQAIAIGKNVRGISAGDIVFTHSNHASYARGRVLVVKVPDGLNPVHAVFARMASVAITALRASSAELGDKVAIVGLGVVGNLAAQIFNLAGCETIGIDYIPKRLQVASACGIGTTVNPSARDPIKAVKEWTDGKGCEVVIEASGNPQGALMGTELAGVKGEVILLGSPRKPLQANVTELLRRVHLWEYGCLTLKGAHEWRQQIHEDPQGFAKHSIERNTKILLHLIAEGRLRVEPLLTHVLHPDLCAEAYRGLREDPDKYVGVVFDWRP
jgi:2-desacetyl-2-hydroxyethyl bacteriochlorophyllide A dehydrogenase